MKAHAAGVILGLIAVVADQAHKLYMLGPFDIAAKGHVALTPFFDLVLVWNKGVSYGLFTQDGELGRWVLFGIGILGTGLFTFWLWRTRALLSALCFGLVAGGALSNALDRLIHGAVADFFLFHVGSFEWYVFNLADVWIVAGAIGLFSAWMRERPENATVG